MILIKDSGWIAIYGHILSSDFKTGSDNIDKQDV